MIGNVLHGDCLELMKDISDKSIDMILCDLPFGILACKWDSVIPFDKLWEQYERIIKDNAAIVLCGTQPFTSQLVMSNPKLFKYEWIWKKSKCSNFLHARNQPLKQHENVLVFSKGKAKYNPQMTMGEPYTPRGQGAGSTSPCFNAVPNPHFRRGSKDGSRYPLSIQSFQVANHGIKNLHPTQKPVELFEYLIKTYTNEGDTVLDNCAGSFTTAIAAMNLNRQWICMEQDSSYCEVGRKRIIENEKRLLKLN
jgi:site-specific DNA-methyltransferase (adenine-specific)